MAERSLVVKIIGDDRQLSRAYARANGQSQKFYRDQNVLAERAARDRAKNVARTERSLSKDIRGGIAGSGLFSGSGRALAFGSLGFLGSFAAASGLRASIDEGNQAAATQKQLEAQFRASGQSLAEYRDQIEKTNNRLSELAGFTKVELNQSFTAAFRGTNSVTTSLKINAIAANVARGRNISLAQATLALVKAYGGQTAGLRRLGVLIPSTLHGMDALNFVQQRFAGQAQAGTTQQQRFSAQIKNTEEVIGTALLPSFNKALGALSKWLAKQDNQKKIAHDASTATKVLGVSVKVLGAAWDGSIGKGIRYAQTIERIDKAAYKYLKTVNSATPRAITGEDVRLRATVIPPITGEDVRLRGAGALTSVLPRRLRASLNYRISLEDEKLAKDEALSRVKAQRADLVRLKELTREKIAKTKDLAERTQLYQTLGSLDQQIKSIDAKAAADRKSARDKEKAAREKELAAKKKQHDAEVAAYKKTQEQATKLLKQFRDRVKAQQQALKDALSAVRGELGGLPFPDVSATKGILGVKQPGIGSFTQSIHNQTRQFTGFFKDLNRLGKRGAPGQFLAELRAGGVQNAAFVHTLATSSGASLKKLFREVAKQEKVVQQIAHADVHAQTVVVHARSVQMGGGRGAATAVATRRGRQAGVPLSIGSYIGG